MNIIRITRFSDRVFEAVLKLLPQVSTHSELPTIQYFKDIITSENIHFLISELDNKDIAGMLTIATCKTPTGIKVWIEDVVVDEAQRGKGYGEKLIQYAINYSRSLGTKEIGLTSRPSRIAANRLYQKLGFIQYNTNVYKYQLEQGVAV
jgi:ribosomal protein S18 acetylase RimI-like enzyme